MQKIHRKKYQYLVNKREKIGLKSIIEYSNDMQDICDNIEEYNLGKKRKVLIAFDDVITDMIINKKLNPVVTELFMKGRSLNMSICFATHSYFKVPKDIRPNYTHFLMKIPNKR